MSMTLSVFNSIIGTQEFLGVATSAPGPYFSFLAIEKTALAPASVTYTGGVRLTVPLASVQPGVGGRLN